MAALRGGAGLVRLAVPGVCLDVVAGFEPAYMHHAAARRSRRPHRLDRPRSPCHAAGQATVVGLGPGLGRSLGLTALVSWLYQHLPQPMVVDADALNALATRPEVLPHPGGPRILTPHPGEFARLIGRQIGSPSSGGGGRRSRRPLRRRGGAQRAPHVRQRRPPPGDQHHRQSRHGHRRHGRRAHRADHGPGLPEACALGGGPARRATCTAWPATWRPRNWARRRWPPAT